MLRLLGAIVTDRGGQLSRAAVVAREFGIPAVVGTRPSRGRVRPGVRRSGSRRRVRLAAGALYLLQRRPITPSPSRW
ncbi:MAG TPA: PEP-utilizing enzyme [Aldersonia sp.]